LSTSLSLVSERFVRADRFFYTFFVESFIETKQLGALGILIERGEEALLFILKDSPIYRKHVRVLARRAKEGEIIETILRNGHKESENRAKAGDWVITNPLGERYTISDATFQKRYEATAKDGIYRPRGWVRALKNPFAQAIFLRVSWGELQHGDSTCMIAVSCNSQGEIESNPYLIDKHAFCKTYRKVS
jgi:hypothetical protein